MKEIALLTLLIYGPLLKDGFDSDTEKCRKLLILVRCQGSLAHLGSNIGVATAYAV